MRFNPPPGWPQPPDGWTPPPGWTPDPAWPAMPDGWQLWISDELAAIPTDPEPAAPASAPVAAESAAKPTVEAPIEAAPGSLVMPGEPTSTVEALQARIGDLEQELALARTASIAGPGAVEVVELDDQKVLQDVGIYRYHHPLEDAAAYKERLGVVNTKIDALVKGHAAVLASDMFTFDGSLAKGRKMTADLSKLMLRAYNAEADNCVRSLRAGNVTTALGRLERAMTAIEKLGTLMEIRINPDYHQVRVEELELTADYQMKVQEERERAREQRAELREQKRAEAELAAERERLDKERAHYVGVLETLRAKGDESAVTELETRLGAIDEAIEANDFRAANIRAGYIYVISNIGAMGPNVVKIGMTRRLEPADRVRELGDASVPFLFDTHALFFSEDAVTLENELHKAFADRRVNHVNTRREFFFATPTEVRQILVQKVGGLLEFNETPEAPEYFQSRNLWPALE